MSVVLILGKRGSGKSFRLRSLLESESRFLLYNTLGEPEYSRFETVGSFPELVRALKTPRTFLRLNYIWDGRLEREADFEYVCQAAYETGKLTFAVDEVDTYCAPNFLPRHLDRIVSLGRHRDINFWCATRRPKEIPPLIRAQATRVVSFVQHEAADIEWCRQVMGDDAFTLPNLGRYKALDWQDGQVSSPQKEDVSGAGGHDLPEQKPALDTPTSPKVESSGL